MRDPSLTEQEKIKVLGLREEMRLVVLSMMQPDGLFQPLAKALYWHSAGYVNPLSGLALISLIDSCPDGRGGKKEMPKSLGILGLVEN